MCTCRSHFIIFSTGNLRCFCYSTSTKESGINLIRITIPNPNTFSQSYIHFSNPIYIFQILYTFFESYIHFPNPIYIFQILYTFSESYIHFPNPIYIFPILNTFYIHFPNPIYIFPILYTFSESLYTFSESYIHFPNPIYIFRILYTLILSSQLYSQTVFQFSPTHRPNSAPPPDSVLIIRT